MASLADLQAERERLKAACANDLQRRQILDKEIARLRYVIKRELPRALRRMKSKTKTSE